MSMRIARDDAFHTNRANELRSSLDNDPSGLNRQEYIFHLERARAWKRLCDERETDLNASKAKSPGVFYESSAFHDIIPLIRYCLSEGDLDRARRWYEELKRFQPYLRKERTEGTWDFSDAFPRDEDYEDRIRSLEREVKARGEIPLSRREDFARRMVEFGDLAQRFEGAEEARSRYEQGARMLEPFAFVARGHWSFALPELYLRLRWLEPLKQYNLWLVLQSDNAQTKALLHQRIAVLDILLAQTDRARAHLRTAAFLVEQVSPMKATIGPIWGLADAALLYARAGSDKPAQRLADEVLPTLHLWEDDKSWPAWSGAMEMRRRILLSAGRSDEARSVTRSLLERCLELAPGYVALVARRELDGYALDPHLGAAFCWETLGELDRAVDALRRAVSAYEELLDAKESVQEGREAGWEAMIIICTLLERKVSGRKNELPPRDDEVHSLLSILGIQEMRLQGLPRSILDDEILEWAQEFATRARAPLPWPQVVPYWSVDEDAFLEQAEESERSQDLTLGPEEGLRKVIAATRKEGWPEQAVRELVRLHEVRGFRVWGWPPQARGEFRNLVERGADLGWMFTLGFSEWAVIQTLIGSAQGVVS